ncbi:hybrid sensor histidine kinase/response regulator [filamentous cyanobacterium CCT1]|nr:hybrid sensor histidine kinase/response regulator [filamentous cyanobacterium CCT1]PSN79126.1 hybrid sensor histidine kinase/response regulator [filamentous cyanobacterium CCP4]
MHHNAYLRQLLGVSPDSNISKSAPADQQPAYRVLQNGQEIPATDLPMQMAARLGVEVRDAEFDILLPDGRVHQLLSYATPLRDDQNQVRGVVGAFLDITKRNQDASALKASQQCYRELAEAMPQMIWTADATGAIAYRNQRWYEYTGLSEAESIGISTASTVHPDERDRALAQWQAAIATGEPFEAECRFRRWDGEYQWFICRAIPTRDSQTQITGWIGTITNIDDIKRSEAIVQRQLAEIEAIYQSAPIGLNVLDPELRFVRINQRLADINGLPVDAHRGRTLRELFPELADTAEPLLRSILQTGEPLLNVEIHGETPAQPGVQRTWLEHFLPLKAGDQVVGISTVCEEITERIQIEAALRASEERFRDMADHAPVMIWVTDATGYCTYLNRGWYEFTGQTETMALGFGWLDAVHPDDSEASKTVFLNATRRQEAFRLEYRLRHKDGDYRWAIDAASPWLGENGEFKGYIGSVIDISDRVRVEDERKQAEEALRVSEERYRTLFESMDEGFCVIEMLFDQNGKPIDYLFLETNPSFERQCGLYNVQGKRMRELIPNHDEHWFEIYGSVALTGTPIRFENSAEVLQRWYDLYAFRIGQPDSRKVAVLFKNITERKQAEQELQESEARFRTLADNISQFAWMIDGSGQVIWCNQRWFDYTGTTLKEVQDWGWQRVHHPDHVDRVVKKFRHCLETGETWEDTFPLRGQDGQYRWFLSRAVPVCDDQGKVLRWFGTNTDITERVRVEDERKRTEAALQVSEERYRSLVEATAHIIWNELGDRGEFISPQPAWSAFTGQTFDELKGWGWLDAVHPDDREATTQAWLIALENRALYEFEHRVRRRDGVYRHMTVRAVPVFEDNGAIREWVGVHSDVTDRKQAEAEREQLLQREQAAREAAERANRIKDEFLAVLSHELRSPLNPILGWAKLLQMRKFDETQTSQALATIERNAKLQTQLIDDLLDVAKILRGKLSLNVTSVNLSSMIEAATETVKANAIAKSISIHSLLPNIGLVSGDVARLQQIVWNLLSNAIKFTPQGGRVDIHLERDGDQAKITVRDTGKGINPAFLPYIFETFRQEDASITRQYGGLGLGLAIVRQLVEVHDGTITADSPGEGFGATFTVRLPLLNVTPAIQTADGKPQQDLNLAGIRVLLVDDEPDARELVTVLLTEYGADVLAVASASEVLASLESFQPDVLVSDVAMPDVDGYALIQQVRTLPATQGGQIPAISLTAYAREEDYQRSINSGFDQHVTKPLEPERLVRALMTLAAPQA